MSSDDPILTLDIYGLAEMAREQGYTQDLVIRKLRQRIEDDQHYLRYRQSRGRQTSHDSAVREYILVTALVVEVLLAEGEK
jgi:hypothetical protein